MDVTLIGTRPAQIARAKELFRVLAGAKRRKRWIAQAPVNFADDKGLLALCRCASLRHPPGAPDASAGREGAFESSLPSPVGPSGVQEVNSGGSRTTGTRPDRAVGTGAGRPRSAGRI